MLTFRNLFPIGVHRPKEFIGRCGQILGNRMQCTKGGTWEVTDDETNTRTQYCTYHASLLEEKQKQALAQPSPAQPTDKDKVNVNDEPKPAA